MPLKTKLRATNFVITLTGETQSATIRGSVTAAVRPVTHKTILSHAGDRWSTDENQ